MARTAPPTFSPEHIAQFHRTQALRPVVLRALADRLEVWRSCPAPGCRRARGCQDSHGVACLRRYMQAMPDEDRRLIYYAIDNRSRGLPPDHAIALAMARIAEERGHPEI